MCVWSSGCAGCVACALGRSGDRGNGKERNSEETAVSASVRRYDTALSRILFYLTFPQPNCLAVHRHVLRCVSSIYLAPGLPLEAAEGIEWAER